MRMIGDVTRRDAALSLVVAAISTLLVNVLIGFESVPHLLGFSFLMGIMTLFRKNDGGLIFVAGALVIVSLFIIEANVVISGFAVAILLVLLVIKVRPSMYGHAVIGLGIVCLMIAPIILFGWANFPIGSLTTILGVASVGRGLQVLRRNDNIVRETSQQSTD